MNLQETTTVEVTPDKTVSAKLRKRIHLPTDIYSQTHEERFIGTGEQINKAWLESYNYKTGWTICWLDAMYAIKRAEKVEVILRRHRLGNFILFRIWKEAPHG